MERATFVDNDVLLQGETERKPVGLDIMLHVIFLQQWFALSDLSVEVALYESAVLRRFADIDLGIATIVDAEFGFRQPHSCK